MSNSQDSMTQEEQLKQSIIAEVIRLNKEYQKQYPGKTISRDYFRRYYSKKIEGISFYTALFGGFKQLLKAANITRSKEQDNKMCRDSFDIKIDAAKKPYPRGYFVTAAIAGATLEKDFFESVLTYCKYNNYKLLIELMRGVRLKEDYFDDDILQYSDHFCTEYIFNKNLRAFDFMLSPQFEKPISGLTRYGHKGHSMIIASPKQQLASVPVGKEKLPHIVCSTGSITMPDYANNKAGRKAHQDHVCGGLVVEIEDAETFHIRQVQSDKHGGFYDLNKYYSKNKVKTISCEALVLGDIHTGFEDENAMLASKEQIKLLNPRTVVLHDVFDGHSINHHHLNNIKRQVKRIPKIDTLEKELRHLGDSLVSLTSSFPKQRFVIVRSNHDEFLDRYLNERNFVNDRVNYRLALQLALWQLDDNNPIQEFLYENDYLISNATWLTREQDFKIEGIQVGSHGDKGSNGGRASITTLELAYGNSMSGHSHSPAILRNTWIVGTNTKLRMDYNADETSSWLHANGVIYPGGTRSMLISINGRWRLPDGKRKKH